MIGRRKCDGCAVALIPGGVYGYRCYLPGAKASALPKKLSAPDLSMESAWEAAELAGIASDIREMPVGMFTLLSEGEADFREDKNRD